MNNKNQQNLGDLVKDHLRQTKIECVLSGLEVLLQYTIKKLIEKQEEILPSLSYDFYIQELYTKFVVRSQRA